METIEPIKKIELFTNPKELIELLDDMIVPYTGSKYFDGLHPDQREHDMNNFLLLRNFIEEVTKTSHENSERRSA